MNAPKSPHRSDPPTVDRLRSDIDEGRTSDKVPYPDPAAAPLGADDEAAGTPPTEEERRVEEQARSRGEAPPRKEPGMLVLYALLMAGVVLVIVGALALLRM